MGSILKKKNGKYRVMFDNPDSTNRNQRQKTFNTKTEAQRFLREVEYKKDQNKLLTPKNKTVEEFFNEWSELYAKSNWQGATYDTNIGIVRNHIIPALGQMDLNKVKPLDIEKFIDSLRTKRISGSKMNYHTPEDELPYLSATTIRYIYIILKQAFDKAVSWQLIELNPVTCNAPQRSPLKKRSVWNFDEWYLALLDIQDELLHLAVHAAFLCSLRPGEVVGLTWDCVDFENKKILINKTLQRFSTEALEKLPGDEIIKVFPEKSASSKSRLVLKIPKTTQSERYIYITDSFVEELRKRKNTVEKHKQFLEDGYIDYNLVFCLEDGTPTETNLIERWFKRWQKKSVLEIPHIIFRELRHSSTTFKLKESEGDIKSVIADTGHTKADTAVNIYAQIVDKDRKALTSKIEERFNQKDSKEIKISDVTQFLDIDSEEININALAKILSTIKAESPELHKKVLAAVLSDND